MSIKKIAELANTSPASVSRVLNDPEHICHDPELAKRIWEIAGRLNYLPNSAARELRKGKPQLATSLTIDLFLTRFDSLDIDPFFYELFQFLQDVIQKKIQHQVLSHTKPQNIYFTKKQTIVPPLFHG